MRAFLVYAYPWGLLALLAACLLLLLASARRLARALRENLSPGAAAAAGILFAAALALRLWAVPRAHYVYFDEYEHLDISWNLSRLGVFAESLAAGTPELNVFSVPLWPAGFHTMMRLVFWASGPSESAAFAWNSVLGGLSVLLVFLLGGVFLKDETAGLLAALWLALSPLHLRFSASTDITVCSLFWVSAALLLLALRPLEPRAFLLFLAALLYALHCRLENILLLPIFWTYAKAKGWRPELSAGARSLAAAAFALGLLPLGLLAALNARRAIPGYADSAAMLATHFADNLRANLRWLLDPGNGRALLLALALAGTWRERRKLRAEALLLGGFFAAFLLFYTSYHIGNLAREDSSRYGMLVDLPLFLLAALGARSLTRSLPRPRAAALALACLALLPLRLPQPPASLHRQEDEFIRSSANLLPPGLQVVSYSPAAILVAARRPALSPYLLLENYERLAAPEMVLFKDYWWHQKAEDSEKLERRLRQDYDASTLASATIEGREYSFCWLRRRRLQAHEP